MSKDIEQLRLNMITSMMDLDYESLMEVKEFMQNKSEIGWKDHINEGNVEFVDYANLKKKPTTSANTRKQAKPNIVFL